MGRSLSPCLGDLDPNLYRRRLDEALRLFVSGGDGGARLIAHVEHQMHAAAAEQRYERAIWLRRRAGRLTRILERLDGVLEATHAHARLVLAPHPIGEAFDAFWLAGGRLVDWGPLPDPSELQERTRLALTRGSRAGELGAHIPPDEVDEIRIIATYLASHPETPQQVLSPDADLDGFVQENGSSATSAVAPA
jgi:DNA polymerase-3 subunit epsilon